MRPSYTTAIVVGSATGLVISLSLFTFLAASGGIPSLTAVVDGTDVVPTFAPAASATWMMVLIAGVVAGAVISTVTYAVARVIDPDVGSVPLAIIAPLGAIVGAVIGMVIFPLGITVLGSISEGNAIIGVADMVILTAIAGLVGGGSVAWLSYLLARPSAPIEDTELLAT